MEGRGRGRERSRKCCPQAKKEQFLFLSSSSSSSSEKIRRGLPTYVGMGVIVMGVGYQGRFVTKKTVLFSRAATPTLFPYGWRGKKTWLFLFLRVNTYAVIWRLREKFFPAFYNDMWDREAIRPGEEGNFKTRGWQTGNLIVVFFVIFALQVSSFIGESPTRNHDFFHFFLESLRGNDNSRCARQTPPPPCRISSLQGMEEKE